MTDQPFVRLDVEAGVATVTLDSPANRNALSKRLRRELIGHLDAAIADAAVRVIVLTHTGPVFCAGMDLKESGGTNAAGQGVHEFPRILETIWSSPTPVVARLAGSARAGGIGIVAACDIAIAVDTATFAFSEVRIGVVPAVISATVLQRMQPRAANELYLTGETFDAARAVAAGLLNAAVPAADLDAVVARYVDMLRLGAPEAIGEAKRLLRRSPAVTLRDDLAELSDLSARSFAGVEGQEGIRAFVEKRSPSWVSHSPDRPPPDGSTR